MQKKGQALRGKSAGSAGISGTGVAYDGNAVYNYAQFEEPEKKAKIRQKKGGAHLKQKKGLSVPRAVAYMLVFVSLASMLIYARVVQMELNNQYNYWSTQVNKKKSENATLQLELETKLSLGNIESYAKEKLNMSEIKNQQIKYINFDNHNKAEVIEQKSFWENLLTWFKELVN